MDPGQFWFLVVHLTAAGLALGGMVFFGGIFIPRARRACAAEPDGGARLIVAGMRAFHPLYLASLGVLIVSGGFYLPRLKMGLGAEYFARLHVILGVKLLLVFILALLASYQCFGVGLPLERSVASEAGEGDGRPGAGGDGEARRRLGLLRRLQGCAVASVVVLLVIISLGVAMGRY